MKNILLFALMLVALSSKAQDCTKELLAQKPGTWKAGMIGSIAGVTSTDLVKEKAVLAEFTRWFQRTIIQWDASFYMVQHSENIRLKDKNMLPIHTIIPCTSSGIYAMETARTNRSITLIFLRRQQ